MTEKYDDALIRDNFQDTGSIPTKGTPYASPDIIPFGSGLLSFDRMVSTYSGPDLAKPVTNGASNNIYIRAKNISTHKVQGRVTLFWARPSLLLTPDQWNLVAPPDSSQSTVPLVNVDGKEEIAPGQICSGAPAFNWQGQSGEELHYCLVAAVSTPLHPLGIPQRFDTNADFSRWVSETPQVAWRNVILVPGKTNTFSQALTIGNLDGQACEFQFLMTGKNVPTENSVQVQCADHRCSFEWTGSLPRPDSRGNQSTAFTQVIPGRLETSAVCTLTVGVPFPPDFAFGIQLWKPPTSREDMSATRPAELAPESLTGPTPLMIPIGECFFATEAPREGIH
ncbi:hypothetical protein ABT154_29775 [Streptomyces sp. NPDC001728]|uniref:hypothetical protein n=1 Tax=Streptomyces sp. NPDC001728 TaxID=3154396 RepID=UPI0033327FB8